MKRRTFALLMAILALCNVTSAQGYSVRIAFNTNLRAYASLDARIIETAPAGATLSVIGSSGRWLRISRNGGEVWMAGWVSHDRVENPPPATLVEIDNCCFVDRQCNTDQQWTDGYYAFQNNQCAVSDPMQAGQLVSVQTEAGRHANVDNCCDLNWNCTTEEQWSRGYQGYRTNQCKHPGAAIEGSPAFIARIEETFDLLAERSPHWYQYALTGLDKIQEAPHRQGGAWVWSADARTEIPTSWAFPNRSLEYTLTRLASTLVHEACHIHRHLAGVEPWGLIGETACTELEVATLQKIALPDNGRLKWLLEVLANIHDPAYQWWN